MNPEDLEAIREALGIDGSAVPDPRWVLWFLLELRAVQCVQWVKWVREEDMSLPSVAGREHALSAAHVEHAFTCLRLKQRGDEEATSARGLGYTGSQRRDVLGGEGCA